MRERWAVLGNCVALAAAGVRRLDIVGLAIDVRYSLSRLSDLSLVHREGPERSSTRKPIGAG